MKTLRQLHLYLGCMFAPLILYFSLSGAWQVFRFNDLKKDETPTMINKLVHELSKPHTHSTLPNLDSKTESSAAFNWISVLMALGMVATTLIGIALAIRFAKKPIWVAACLILGVCLPVLALFFH